jgi:hypothetical protein
MEHWFKYCVLRHTPNPVRGEIINIGIAIVLEDGSLDIHIPNAEKKLAALSSSVTMKDINTSVNSTKEVAEAISRSNSDLAEQLFRQFLTGFVTCSEFVSFKVSAIKSYESQVEELLNLMVVMPKMAKEGTHKRISTRVKNIFENHNLLGGRDDIDNHLVVPNYEIDDQQGLVADFALQNSVMHVTQTIEFNSTDVRQKRQQSALNALTLDRAKQVYGDDTKKYVVYSIAKDKDESIEKSLFLLKGHADYLINMKDKNDFNDYIDMIRTAATQSSIHNYRLQ